MSSTRAYEVVIHAGPLPPLRDPSPSPADLAFRALLERPAEYSRFTAEARARWMRERGVTLRREP